MPDNKKKAILYAQPTMDESRPQSPVPLPQRKLFHAVANPLVPPLLLPKEDYPSVLVVEALSTCSLVIRWSLLSVFNKAEPFYFYSTKSFRLIRAG